jgi:hypothetical protein
MEEVKYRLHERTKELYKEIYSITDGGFETKFGNLSQESIFYT